MANYGEYLARVETIGAAAYTDQSAFASKQVEMIAAATLALIHTEGDTKTAEKEIRVAASRSLHLVSAGKKEPGYDYSTLAKKLRKQFANITADLKAAPDADAAMIQLLGEVTLLCAPLAPSMNAIKATLKGDKAPPARKTAFQRALTALAKAREDGEAPAEGEALDAVNAVFDFAPPAVLEKAFSRLVAKGFGADELAEAQAKAEASAAALAAEAVETEAAERAAAETRRAAREQWAERLTA